MKPTPACGVSAEPNISIAFTRRGKLSSIPALMPVVRFYDNDQPTHINHFQKFKVIGTVQRVDCRWHIRILIINTISNLKSPPADGVSAGPNKSYAFTRRGKLSSIPALMAVSAFNDYDLISWLSFKENLPISLFLKNV